jgi:hypothetical protein
MPLALHMLRNCIIVMPDKSVLSAIVMDSMWKRLFGSKTVRCVEREGEFNCEAMMRSKEKQEDAGNDLHVVESQAALRTRRARRSGDGVTRVSPPPSL